MKLALPHLLLAATTASNLPDGRFRKELIFDAPFLPVNPTFINILNFMGTVAITDFDERFEPDTYTNPMYPQVQITTDRWTEARFLLWGIYLTAIDMVKFSRFHNVLIKLYWENNLVGQMSLMAKPSLKLPSTTRNDTRDFIDDSGEPSLAKISKNIVPSLVERLNLPLVRNTTSTDIVSAVNSDNRRLSTLSISSKPPNQSLPNAPLSTTLSITFARIAGAKKSSRNDVFLTFYTAILHLAESPAKNDMKSFNSKLPSANLRVNMLETGFGCSNHQAIAALVYVPRYMMEHPGFGYEEVMFTVELGGILACRGSLL